MNAHLPHLRAFAVDADGNLFIGDTGTRITESFFRRNDSDHRGKWHTRIHGRWRTGYECGDKRRLGTRARRFRQSLFCRYGQQRCTDAANFRVRAIDRRRDEQRHERHRSDLRPAKWWLFTVQGSDPIRWWFSSLRIMWRRRLSPGPAYFSMEYPRQSFIRGRPRSRPWCRLGSPDLRHKWWFSSVTRRRLLQPSPSHRLPSAFHPQFVGFRTSRGPESEWNREQRRESSEAGNLCLALRYRGRRAFVVGGGWLHPAGPVSLSLPVSATIGGADSLPFQYAGVAPTLIAGAVQINVQVPSGASGTALPVVIKIGGVLPSPG